MADMKTNTWLFLSQNRGTLHILDVLLHRLHLLATINRPARLLITSTLTQVADASNHHDFTLYLRLFNDLFGI